MAHVDFPYGKKRNWEFDTTDADIGLKSISDSCVIAHSLRQSRDKWLYHTFQKFTSKARGAKALEPPPPHTIMSRGKCDFLVGPHQFRQTTFYEVHYMQPVATVQNYQSPTTPAPTTSFSSFPINNPQPSNPESLPGAPPPATAASGLSDGGDISQLKLALGGGLEYTISADLVARIHHEASVNPIFATKFRLAVEPNATPEQIRNFAFALPHLPGVKVSGAPTSLTLSTEQVRLPPVREWDLVIEFHEAPNERWLIPRDTLASCSRLVLKDGSNLFEASLTLRLPLSQTKPQLTTSAEPSSSAENSATDSAVPRPVKFTLHRTPSAVYDLILNWIGGEEKNRENAAALAKIPKRQKVYLPHQLSQGALLTQLQTAQTPGYTMKPLKHGPSAPPRPRRKAVPKPKPVPQQIPAASGTPSEVPNGTINTAVFSPQPSKTSKMPKEPKEPKRRRFQVTAKPATVIRCFICSKTDVPLMMGGRYCRECVDSGKATSTIPEVPRKLSSYNSSLSIATSSSVPQSASTTSLPTTSTTIIPTASPAPSVVPPAINQNNPAQDTSNPGAPTAVNSTSVQFPSTPSTT